MPLPNSPWTTDYPTQQDNLAVNQPDQVQDSAPGAQDGNRVLVSHLHTLRDKLDAVALKVGDNSNLPAGCLLERSAAAIHDDTAGEIAAIAEKVTPVSGDWVMLEDSADSNNKKRAQLGNLPGGAALDEKSKVSAADTTTSYLDSKVAVANGIQKAILNPAGNEQLQLSPSYGSSANTVCEGNDARLSDNRTDANAIHDNVAGEIVAITEKVTPVAGDWVILEDSADSNNKKRAQLGNLPGGSASPLTTKGDLFTFDTGDQRLAVGTNGQILSADSAEATGLKWINSAAGGNPLVEETFATTGAETPGDPTTFALTNAPGGGGTASTPSGYHIFVYRNGNKMGYANPPTTYLEYYYDSVNNEIDVLASGSADAYEVLMVEATSSWESYAGHMEDKPPTSPSAYDDEFDGVSLDPKWGWYGAGEPSTGGESNSVANGRMNVVVNPVAISFGAIHFLLQSLPAQNFEFYAKLYSQRMTNYETNSLVLYDTGVNYGIMANHGYHGSYGGAAAYWINRWQGSWLDDYTNANMLVNPAIHKIEYNISTKVVKAYYSIDGFNWRLVYTSAALTFTPNKFGLCFTAPSSGSNPNLCNVEWFRVNLL